MNEKELQYQLIFLLHQYLFFLLKHYPYILSKILSCLSGAEMQINVSILTDEMSRLSNPAKAIEKKASLVKNCFLFQKKKTVQKIY